MTRKTRKRLLRFILLPIAILVIFVVVAVGILFSQQQRLVGLAVKELNHQLPGELVVGGSDISVFQTFPYISIGLNKVQFYPGKQRKARPLYEAERMFVGFSLPDILKQKYHVKVILLKNGHLDLVEDSVGKLNIVEASRMTRDTTAVKDTASTVLDLAIKKVVLKNMDISFRDKQNGQQVAAHIDRIQSSLKEENGKVYAGLKGAMIVDYIRPGDTTLFRHKQLETELSLSYDRSTQLLNLPIGKLRLGDAAFNITGTADLLHDNNVDIKITGDKPDFRQLFAFAPESVTKELKHFRYDGHLNFEGTIKGKLKGGRQPLIELSFTCTNAWLHNMTADKKLDSLAFKGYYTNGPGHNLQTSELRLLDMNARPGKGVFKGNFVMRDFTNPKILMQLNSELELEFIGAFLGIKDLQRLTGHISLKMNFKELVDISVPEHTMGKLTEGVQSELTVSNLTFRIPNYPYMVEHLNLHADMRNGFVKLDSLSFKLGHSDFKMDGSLDDLPALFHHQQKPVLLTLNAHSGRLILKELLASDSVRARDAKEEIHDLDLALSLQTSVDELRHPNPLPKGKLKVEHFSTAFKNYPHAFRDFSGELTINDTALFLRSLTGRIDSSDLRFGGRVTNYALWFDKVKKGKTQVAFDLKSRRLAIRDLLGKIGRSYLPRGYRREVLDGVWLRSKIDLRYDSIFQFANIKIANVTGALQLHPIRLDSLSGNIKFGIDHFLKIDTLRGRIGNSDFDLSMRLYTGKDTARRKKENFLQFSSHLIDVAQLNNYVAAAQAAPQRRAGARTKRVVTQTNGAVTQTGGEVTQTGKEVTQTGGVVAPAPSPVQSVSSKPVTHDDGFNIFQIPFIDFRAAVKIDKIKYPHLSVKNFATNVRMQTNQQLYLDTLSMEMAGGRIAARAHFNGSNPNKIYLRSRINVEDVNIEKMLLKLDYFGQDYTINKNIKGILSGQVKSFVQVHPDLTPLIDQSQAQLDLEILNGTLVNFGPMQALSSYFKDKNLNMVRFDTLRNTLTFKNGALVIPDMNINSSLGFLEISGQQSMDMHMEYYLRIPLKMVTQVGFRMLFGKKQEDVDPDQVDAIEYRNKDKRVRFMNLKITGTPGNYKVGLGKAKKS
jgi:hypothetical protein